MHTLLDQMVETGQVAPVLLLTGPKEAIDIAFAKALSKKLMGTQHGPKIDSGHHPDLHLYQIEGKSGMHSVLSMQQLIKEVFLPPLEAKVKIFIIDEAHRMLPASSNSLLKTLEEPPSDCFIILLSCKPELLLPTIVSRCRKVVLSLPHSVLAKELEEPLDHLFKAYSENDYVRLLKEAARIEERILEEETGSSAYFQKVEQLFQMILQHFCTQSLGKEIPLLKLMGMIEQSQLAIERNMKLRTIIINFFLSL